jgi:putative signal transducing protein
MKKVYSSDNFVMAGHIHSLLEANDIVCHLRNMNLTGGIGELPLNECWPEVWVNDESDAASAEHLIKIALSQPEKDEAWQCPCGESIEGQFEVCWSCGNEKVSNY